MGLGRIGRELFEFRPQPPRQCEVRSARIKYPASCQYDAQFVITRGDQEMYICSNCIISWLFVLTKDGVEVMVRRVK